MAAVFRQTARGAQVREDGNRTQVPRTGRVITAKGRSVAPVPTPEQPGDGPELMGPAYNDWGDLGPGTDQPVPGTSITEGLTSWASNGDRVRFDYPAPGVPYGWPFEQMDPAKTRGARDYAPTLSVFLNDLRHGFGPARAAQPVPTREYHPSVADQQMMRPFPRLEPTGIRKIAKPQTGVLNALGLRRAKRLGVFD